MQKYLSYLKIKSLRIIINREHYSNFEKESFYETETTPHFKITRGYSSSGVLFSNNVIYLNRSGNPIMVYDNVDQIPGHYRRINSEGKHSYKAYDTFHECMLHKGESLT